MKEISDRRVCVTERPIAPAIRDFFITILSETKSGDRLKPFRPASTRGRPGRTSQRLPTARSVEETSTTDSAPAAGSSRTRASAFSLSTSIAGRRRTPRGARGLRASRRGRDEDLVRARSRQRSRSEPRCRAQDQHVSGARARISTPSGSRAERVAHNRVLAGSAWSTLCTTEFRCTKCTAVGAPQPARPESGMYE